MKLLLHLTHSSISNTAPALPDVLGEFFVVYKDKPERLLSEALFRLQNNCLTLWLVTRGLAVGYAACSIPPIPPCDIEWYFYYVHTWFVLISPTP